jgi:hypothetical protein
MMGKLSEKKLERVRDEASGSPARATSQGLRQDERVAGSRAGSRGKHSIMSEQNLVDAAQQVFADDFGGNFDAGDNGFESGGGDGEPGPGMGQSKSSRRRRRKRKNKEGPGDSDSGAASAEGGPVQQTIVMEGESLSLAGSGGFSAPTPPAAPQAPQARKPQQNNNNNGGGQQQGQGTAKRWKKKFRDRERGGSSGGRRTDSPGSESRADNSSNNGGGGGGYSGGGRPDNFGNLAGGYKRKGGGKSGGGQRERGGFVGPMDHSYRADNPDFSNAPPSTINLQGSSRRHGHRHHGDNQPIDHNMPRPVPIPENAQTHIYFFIEELFFIAKIQESAKKLGVKVAFIKNEKDALAELTSGEEANHPALIVFDLNNANAKPLTTIPKLKTKLKRGTSIVGFLSHLQGDLKAKAMEAGCDVVMPRAAFSQNLPNLLRRYGIEEEDEVNYNY